MQKLTEYEIVFISVPSLDADKQTEKFDTYKKLITDAGGEIIKSELWGTQQLSYPIAKQVQGIYYFAQFKAHGDFIAGFELKMKYDEEIIRFLVVKIDGKQYKLNPRKDPVKQDRRPRYNKEGGHRSDRPMRANEEEHDTTGSSSENSEVHMSHE